MDTASFSGILRTLVIMVLVYYLLKFLFRIFAPLILQQVAKKAGQSFYEHQQHQYTQQNYSQNTSQFQNQQDKSVPERPREKKKVGEYIEYEEIE
ncbi:MAG: DUF4834 family protein [Flavobacterium sp.]|nr:MAG: DUF4834 family protein [Flavobacterium sp.]